MDRIERSFEREEGKVLTTFVTAGFPEIGSLPGLVKEMEKCGVGMVEIGMPFSDPLADGPIIQMSSKIALDNGMHLGLILEQVRMIREESDIPILLMGYLNPVMQYGVERFVKDAAGSGVDGLILPDMPPEYYERNYRDLFAMYNMASVFLITPETPEERVAYIDRLTTGFVYMVSRSSTTGNSNGFSQGQTTYFEMQSKNLKSRTQIGFGISTSADLKTAFQYADGAIVGSMIIRRILGNNNINSAIRELLTG